MGRLSLVCHHCCVVRSREVGRVRLRSERSHSSGEAIDAMRARVSATLHDAQARLAGTASQARTFAGQTMSQADAFVHANPWRAVAIGAGIGALLAVLMSGRHGHGAMGDGGFD